MLGSESDNSKIRAQENPQKNQEDTATEEASSATLEVELEGLQKLLQEEQKKYLYLYAEFDTYKKRALKERADYIKFGHEPFIKELLQVSDNLDRALSHSDKKDALVEGLKMVQSQLAQTLTKHGAIALSTIGAKFDPHQHEAVGQEEITDDKSEDGHIIKEHQKGYTLHGRLLRPARVVIGIKRK